MSLQDFRSEDSPSSDSNSEAESQTSSQIPVNPTQPHTKFMGWKFLDTIQADVLPVGFEERKLKLIAHFRTRTTHDLGLNFSTSLSLKIVKAMGLSRT